MDADVGDRVVDRRAEGTALVIVPYGVGHREAVRVLDEGSGRTGIEAERSAGEGSN